MIRVALKLAVAAAAVWAVWSFVPIGGRSLAERWRAAGGDVSEFVQRGWAEASAAAGSKKPARPQARQKPPPAAARPTEGHTDADRRAVERILADRLDGAQ
jgi:hypothetical protein